MLFNSLDFLIFLPIILIAFYLFPFKLRVFLLLAASYYFYMSWNPKYIILILISTLIDYSTGILLQRNEDQFRRKLLLATSMFLNLGMLIAFKYGDFLLQNTSRVLFKLGIENQSFELLDLVLPVGISFYTFQTMSYTIDVYNRKIKAETNLAYFALYVSYFPQLVAGPIERFGDLMNQLKAKVNFSTEHLERGIYYILFGFFMKMVIADNIGWYIDSAYAIQPNSDQNFLLIALLYPVQIYCDFHGYSTIAIGTAQLFGVRLSLNFLGPFWSSSVTSFWKKWHISLTSWFRDYLYIPIGGSKHGWTKTILATMIVFIISGLWHGSNWNFVAWGFFNGAVVVIEKIMRYPKWQETNLFVKITKGIITYFFVSSMFVYFRSGSIQAANEVISSYTNFNSFYIPELPTIVCFLLSLFILTDYLLRNGNFMEWITPKSITLKWIVSAILLFLILSNSGTNQQPFIYFQF